MPAPVSSWMTGIPAGVAGPFTIKLGRSIADHSRVASAAVAAVSWASSGETLHAHVTVGAPTVVIDRTQDVRRDADPGDGQNLPHCLPARLTETETSAEAV